ncbi:hypothetical protein N7504_004965 [Penicillium tannophilum]|nr:hypothetical protein N7504_004965 [Penicillium tannophilum]
MQDDPNECFDDLTTKESPPSSFNMTGTMTNSIPSVDIDSLFGQIPLHVLAENPIDLARDWDMPTTSDFTRNSNESSYDDLALGQTADSDDFSDLIRIPEGIADVSLSHDSTEWSSLVSRYFHMIEDPPLRPSLENESTTLVQYYFRDTCATWSCFDSDKNPFRTAIEVLWQKSPLIYYAIQSNAAAHLSNQISSMQAPASKMREKAHAVFLEELLNASNTHSTGDQLLLATLLLGVSASWHDSSDLGLSYLSIARSLIRTRVVSQGSEHHQPPNRNFRFFLEALIYWEMVAAFVSGEGLRSALTLTADTSTFPWAGPLATAVIPHPWTGVAPRVMLLFAEVGRLVQDHAISAGQPGADLDLVASATKLEEDLLSAYIPTEDEIADVHDDFNRKNDFILSAEATRCAALLQIYRVFPDVLQWRLSTGNLGIFPHMGIVEPDSGSDMTGSWLIGLAMHVLDLLSSVPSYSGVRCVQLLPLATAAFELRATNSHRDVEIARFREFSMGRLRLLAGRLPSKPISRVAQLLKEVWRRNDRGDHTFWLNVMIDKNWKTFLG